MQCVPPFCTRSSAPSFRPFAVPRIVASLFLSVLLRFGASTVFRLPLLFAPAKARPQTCGALAPSSTFPGALAQTPPATFGLSVPASSDVCRTPCRRGAAAAVPTVAPSLCPGPDCGTYGFDTILTAAGLPSLETLRASSNTFLCPPRRLIRTR